MNGFFSVPKGEEEVRPILNLSDPAFVGFSVNDTLDPALCTVQYIQQLELIQWIKSVGIGGYLWCKDLKWGYNNLPIHPDDVRLLGFEFDGKAWCYQVLPMGASSDQIYSRSYDILNLCN